MSIPSHDLEAYCTMFALGPEERGVSLLGVGDGASSFNAEGTAQGLRIVSVDPLYALRLDELRARLGDRPGGPAEAFLADYDNGVAQGRYVSGSAADLPFFDGCYDLALCAHVLFGEGGQPDLASHLKMLREMLRVAEEVRVFPLSEADGTPSRHLKAVTMALQRMGMQAGIRPVPGAPGGPDAQLLLVRRA